jgi:hypothetical protein
MTRLLALIPDLLFGSQIQGSLTAAGYDVELTGKKDQAEKALAGIDGAPSPAVLIVDLDSQEFDGFEFVRDRRLVGALAATRTLGFYPHVNGDVPMRADNAGFDRVVPRSRMAREAPKLVESLLSG